MKRIQYPLLLRLLACALALGASTAKVSAQTAITATEPVQIYPRTDSLADGVCATLKRNASTIYLFRSAWNRTDKYYGPVDNPQSIKLTPDPWQNKDIFYIPTALQSSMMVDYAPLRTLSYVPPYRMVNFYLMNVYDLGSNRLLGFLHLEYMNWVKQDNGTYQPKYDPATNVAEHYSIALAYSTDLGDHWNFLGDIIRTEDHTSNVVSNIGGAAYIVVGQYFYVYFTEKPSSSGSHYPSVARAKISDVITAAQNGGVVRWMKYNASTNAFDKDGISGLGSQILPANLDMHADAAYCSAAKQYLLATSESDATGSTLALYRSVDGINWGRTNTVAKSFIGSDGNLHKPSYPYFASLGADANSDNSTVGSAFSINYIAQHFEPTVPTDEPIYHTDLKVFNVLPIANMLR